MEIKSLSDDALLSVFSYIDVWGLLDCRLVCRRWRDLVRHPDVWRCQEMSAEFLHLSPPCCYWLALNTSLDRTGFLAATTKCAATYVSVEISRADVTLAALAIRNQASLGRLRKLKIYVPEYGRSESRSPALLDVYSVVLGMEGLRELVFEGWMGYASHPPEELEVERLNVTIDRPSLQELRCYSVLLPSLVYESLVQLHAPCLQKVFIYKIRPFHTKLASLLANATHLRELTCPLIEDMEQLLQCRSLRSLGIYLKVKKLNVEIRCALASARRLLRSATYLNELMLDYNLRVSKDELEEQELGQDLIRSLGRSGLSRLTRLHINSHEVSHSDVLWTNIGPTLSLLPRLKEFLYDTAIHPDRLRDVTPLSTPNLKYFKIWSLTVCPCCSWQKVCDMLKANPELRLSIQCVSFAFDVFASCGNNCGQCIVQKTSNLSYQRALSVKEHIPAVDSEELSDGS